MSDRDDDEDDGLAHELRQLSAEEVPGFAARTAIDDVIGKLWAIRTRLVVDVPPELPGILDDLDGLADDLVGLLLDPDAPAVEDRVDGPADMPEALRRYCGGRLSVSGSDAFWFCSCGGVHHGG